jgi:hypothetical protein
MIRSEREALMRIKPDGTLDEVWWEPVSSNKRTPEQEAEGERTRRKERYARSQHPTKTPEERREPRINNLLRARPTLICDKAAEQIDAVFKGAKPSTSAWVRWCGRPSWAMMRPIAISRVSRPCHKLVRI